MKKINDFSVLMSLYQKEKASYLIGALDSLVKSSVQPVVVIIVLDGPINSSLLDVLSEFKRSLNIKLIQNEYNLGLAKSLNIGLAHVSTKYVARFDTDDICCTTRFEEQLRLFVDRDDSVDVVGSWVNEVEPDKLKFRSKRCPPQDGLELLNYAKFKSPLNHPSVMYKKSVVIEAGGYPEIYKKGYEDYHLWAQLLMNGCNIVNIQKVLVTMRTGVSQVTRRRGLKYVIDELIFVKNMMKIGFFDKYEAMRFLIIKIPLRFMPSSVLSFLYTTVKR